MFTTADCSLIRSCLKVREFSICYTDCSQGEYSNIILTLDERSFSRFFCSSSGSGDIREKRNVEKRGGCVFLLSTVHEQSAVKNSLNALDDFFWLNLYMNGGLSKIISLHT